MTPEALSYHADMMKRVLDVRIGRDNAISVAELAPLIGLTASRDYRDVREVRDHIEEDYPVLSDSAGYWKYEDPDEAIAIEQSLYRTLKSLAKRHARIKRQRKRRYPNWQPPLWREYRKAA